MHRLDALVVSSRELIRRKNIFGVVVLNLQQTVVFLSPSTQHSQDWMPHCQHYSQEHCTAGQCRQDRIFPAFLGFPCPANQNGNINETDLFSPAFPSSCKPFRCPAYPWLISFLAAAKAHGSINPHRSQV